MFTTPEMTQLVTGRTGVTPTHVIAAQTIIESYVGKTEADIEDARDAEILEKATIFQIAYMMENGSSIYDQMAVAQIAQNSSVVSFKAGDFTAPWIAPLAVIACRNLSWRKSRSVKTGKSQSETAVLAPWRTT